MPYASRLWAAAAIRAGCADQIPSAGLVPVSQLDRGAFRARGKSARKSKSKSKIPRAGSVKFES